MRYCECETMECNYASVAYTMERRINFDISSARNMCYFLSYSWSLPKINCTLSSGPELRVSSLETLANVAELIIKYHRTYSAEKPTILSFMEKKIWRKLAIVELIWPRSLGTHLGRHLCSPNSVQSFPTIITSITSYTHLNNIDSYD